MAPRDDLQPGRRRGAPDPSLALQATEDSRPLGTDDEAKDQEELQVPMDQGALPGHLVVQVRLGGRGPPALKNLPFNSSDRVSGSVVIFM